MNPVKVQEILRREVAHIAKEHQHGEFKMLRNK